MYSWVNNKSKLRRCYKTNDSVMKHRLSSRLLETKKYNNWMQCKIQDCLALLPYFSLLRTHWNNWWLQQYWIKVYFLILISPKWLLFKFGGMVHISSQKLLPSQCSGNNTEPGTKSRLLHAKHAPQSFVLLLSLHKFWFYFSAYFGGQKEDTYIQQCSWVLRIKSGSAIQG